MKMAAKAGLMLIAFGLICLLQTTPTNAANKHVRKLLQTFRRIQFDDTKKSFYIHSARYGVQVQLREPLVKKVAGLLNNDELSDACLNRMVDKVKDVEGTFYAEFSYACDSRDQYTVGCLESAKPKYMSGLDQVRSDTERCLTK